MAIDKDKLSREVEDACGLDLSEVVDQFLETAMADGDYYDENGNAVGLLDEDFDVDDLSDEAVEEAWKDCAGFCTLD